MDNTTRTCDKNPIFNLNNEDATSGTQFSAEIDEINKIIESKRLEIYQLLTKTNHLIKAFLELNNNFLSIYQDKIKTIADTIKLIELQLLAQNTCKPLTLKKTAPITNHSTTVTDSFFKAVPKNDLKEKKSKCNII